MDLATARMPKLAAQRKLVFHSFSQIAPIRAVSGSADLSFDAGPPDDGWRDVMGRVSSLG